MDARPRTDSRIASLDGLRAVSVLVVIGRHLSLSGSAPPALARAGRYLDAPLAVRVFFVISGFLISWLLLRERAETGAASLRLFYLRRLIRLAPVQWLFIAVLYGLTLVTPLTLSGCNFLTSLTYTKNYACGAWIDAHLWSLSLEEQFYLFWPVVLVRAPGRIAAMLALVFATVIAPVSRVVEYLHGGRQFTWLSSNVDALMWGCLLAMTMAAAPALAERAARWRPRLVQVSAAAVIGLQEVLFRHLLVGWFTVTYGIVLQNLAVAVLVFSWTQRRGGLCRRVLNHPALVFVGVLSYSLYVWQALFFMPASVFGQTSTPWPLRFPQNLLCCFAAGVCSYYGVERPLLALRRRFRVVRTAAATPSDLRADAAVSTAAPRRPVRS
jgi:peptidoglycan/LPS O-acetylase OafA/YrhL